MDFEDVKQSAEQWCESEDTHFQLQSCDKNERKLVFACGEVSFYVTCPSKGDKTWQIWSEKEDVIANLHETIDHISRSKERSIADILGHATKSLAKLVGNDDDDDDEMGEDDDDDGYYYEAEDIDVQNDVTTPKAVDESDADAAEKYFTGGGSSTAVQRLVKDLKMLKASEGKFGVVGTPDGDNLFKWNVQLTDFPKETMLGKDLTEFARKYKREPVVYMEMKFPKEYPMAPPFVRVVRPRFKFLTGHITIGGSVCVEMLTRSGWRPTNDIESIMVQIRSEIMSDKQARLDQNPDRAYDETEARRAFERMVQRYGWDK